MFNRDEACLLVARFEVFGLPSVEKSKYKFDL